ncbi:MAG: domain S-box protein, partial [Bacteroidota bacterium]|nr:domain S-box protein [Bacteroidota bacterium]
MKLICKIFLLILIYSNLHGAGSDNPTDLMLRLKERWRWSFYGADAGLPDNTIFDFQETRDGTIWALSRSGAYRFDNYTWHNVTGDKFEFNKTMSYTIDDNNGIYIVVRNKLCHITPKGIDSINITFNDKRLIINEIADFGNGRLLLSAKEKDKKFFNLYLYSKDSISIFPSPDSFPEIYPGRKTLKSNKAGIVWFNNGKKLYKWTNNGWKLFEQSKSGLNWDVDFPETDNNGFSLYCISNLPEIRGTYCYNPKLRKVELLDKRIFNLNVDFSKDNEAICYFVGNVPYIFKNGKLYQFNDNPEVMEDIITYRFTSQGDLFVLSQEGVYLCRLKSNLWRYTKFEQKELNNINSIIRARDGSLWIGTSYGLVVQYPDGRQKVIKEINGIQLLVLTGLAQDSVGNIWISSGHAFKGMFKWDGKKWNYFTNQDGIDFQYIHKIRTDSRGRIWFLSLSNLATSIGDGAYFFENNHFKKILVEDSLKSNRCYSFVEGKDGALWFGSLTGLHRLKDGKWKHWDSEALSIFSSFYSVAIDSSGTLWFAARGYGIGYVAADTLVFPQKLIDMSVKDIGDIGFDRYNRLWITTIRGLFCYSDGFVTHFDKSNGLNNIKLWPMVIEKERILIGTNSGGINTLNFEEFEFHNPVLIYDHPIAKENLVYFKWKKFSFHGIIPPEKIEIRYRLDNGIWSNWLNRDELTLYSVTPGKHYLALQVKGLF